MPSSMYAKYWPFRSRSRAAAPRGRLEEESEDISVRGGVNKKKLRESPGAVTDEARAADAVARKHDARTPAPKSPDSRLAAPAPVSPRARHAARGSVAGLTVSVERLGVAEEAETPRFPSRASLESSRSSSSSSDDKETASSPPPRSPSSSPFAPAQPGRALQETPVFAARAVMIKRERSVEVLMKRSNSPLSRSIGRDGRESPTMRREHSWCSDGDISPCPSPVGSPMHAAALATRGARPLGLKC